VNVESPDKVGADSEDQRPNTPRVNEEGMHPEDHYIERDEQLNPLR